MVLPGPNCCAAGGSLVASLDVTALWLDCEDVSRNLLAQKVSATPMRGWGGGFGDRHVRFVFSNEPGERLATLRSSTPSVGGV
jgi:aspartate/methionine/tyrosine aminotransferase